MKILDTDNVTIMCSFIIIITYFCQLATYLPKIVFRSPTLGIVSGSEFWGEW